MAMIARFVLLSLSVQSLLVVNGSMSTVLTETLGSTESVSIETTEATATSYLTNHTVSTSSIASTLTPVATGSTDAASEVVTVTDPGSTLTTLEPSTETLPTTVMTPPSSQMSTESGTTTPTEGGTTTVVADTTEMTSSVTQAVTSESSSGLMTTSATIKMTTEGGPGSDGVSLAVYIAAGVVSGLVVLVIIFAIVVWCIRGRKSKAGSGSRNPFGPDEMDKLDPKDRMSVHRPASASVNASDDLSFVTFNTGAASATASAEYHVSGIENPTYALSNVSEEEESAAGEGGHQDGDATMPSQAHLGLARPTEGAVGSESGKESNMRPLSGVSYTSNDIEGAIETLDIIPV